MKARLAAPALLSLLLTACGSTAQLRGAAGTATALGGGPAATGGSGGLAAASGATAGGPGAGVAGSVVAAQPAAAAAIGSGGVAGAGPAVAGGSTGPAAAGPTAATAALAARDHKPVQVGVLLYPDLNAFAAKFGATADAGNQQVEAQSAVDWLNHHGGLNGHPVQLVVHNVSLTSTDTYDQLAQQACTDFTQDHHVVAVVAPGTSVSNNFPNCLKAAGVLYLTTSHVPHDATDFAQVGNMFAPGEASSTRLGQAMVDLVLGRHLAATGQTVGLMVMSWPGALRAADTVIKPQLQAAGIPVTEYTVPPPASTQDISNSVAVDDSAELKLASQGVKTVIFVCPGCLSFFAQNADSQKYYPRYVISSLDTPAGITGSSNAATMASAVGIGYQPDYDVGLFTHPSVLAGNATRAQCHRVEAPNQQNHNDLSEFATVALCDGFLQLQDAARVETGQPVTGPVLQAGMAALGTAYPSALDFGTDLTPAHHDGETSYRTLHWDGGCTCFAYDSPAPTLFR